MPVGTCLLPIAHTLRTSIKVTFGVATDAWFKLSEAVEADSASLVRKLELARATLPAKRHNWPARNTADYHP